MFLTFTIVICLLFIIFISGIAVAMYDETISSHIGKYLFFYDVWVMDLKK